MKKDPRLAKHITDVGWNQFLQFIEAEADIAKARFVAVNPKNEYLEYPGCGVVVEKGLSFRIHRCPDRNLKIFWDLNAAINILNVARRSVRLTEAYACGDLVSTSWQDRDTGRVTKVRIIRRI